MEFICAVTGITVTKDRLPKGWKRIEGETLSPKGLAKRFVSRVISIPVASPVDASWDDFGKVLRDQWGLVSRASNFIVRELAKAEPPITTDGNGKLKLETHPGVYVYPMLRSQFPQLSSGTASALEQGVTGKYKKARWETFAAGARSLPSFRYPAPVPIRAADWKAFKDADGVRTISFPMNGRRWTVRLRGGHQFARQTRVFDKIASGEYTGLDIKIARAKAHKSDHRGGTVDRESSGGKKGQWRVMVHIGVMIPRGADVQEGPTLVVESAPDCLVTYYLSNRPEERFRLNADHIRRWQAEGHNRRQRIAEDLKYEKRWPSHVRQRMIERLDVWCEKSRNRLDSFTHEVSAMLTNFARRNRAKTVAWHVEDSEYISSFPWFELKSRVQYKADTLGIGFTVTSRAALPETRFP